ncbi:MAG TPA: glycosyltransferase [Solirubrobacterales bacterium]
MGDVTSAPPSPAAPATLSLVIPAYNEEARLPALLETLDKTARAAAERAGLELIETLIVDDGSTDRTREMLAEVEPGAALVTPVLEFAQNRGKGAAFAAGVARARGEYVLLADVDLSTPLEELPKLTAAIREGADIAIGSRAVAGAVVERGPRHRKVLGNTFNATVRLLTGLRLRDTQNGFKLFPAAEAKRLLAKQTCPGFAFDVELLMRADQADLKIAEVPILYMHDPRSSVRVAAASVEMLKGVGGLAYRLRAGRFPARTPSSRRPLTEVPADDSD